VNAPRRFSQAIAEGDGISVLAEIGSADEAAAAAAAGAEALVVRSDVSDAGGETGLPVLWCAGTALDPAVAASAAAILLPADGLDDDGAYEQLLAAADEAGLEGVVEVRDEDELQLALERLDPEILLLSARRGSGDGLEHVLGLLPDVPAGKLAIAELEIRDSDVVADLERAGVDGVVVSAPGVARLLEATGRA
jgi:hypothetical protein